jgi:peptidylprolyl isomerase
MFRLAVCIFCLIGVTAAAADDPVLAEHGEDRITVSQARALIAGTDAPTQHRLTTDPIALKQFLEGVLLQRALLEAAAAQKWDQKPEVASLLQQAREQVITRTYLAAHAQIPPSYPSEAELQAAYDQNKRSFMVARRTHLTQIFLPTADSSSPEEGRKKLMALRTQIQHGHPSMEEAAKRGGGLQYMDLGWVEESQMVPAIKSAIAGLLEGAIADPVCIENGCHLVRLVATRPAGPAPLSEVHDQLVKALRQQKQTEEARAYAASLMNAPRVAIDEIQLGRLAPQAAK